MRGLFRRSQESPRFRAQDAAVYTVQCLKAILTALSFDFVDAYKYVELIQDAYIDRPEADLVWKQVIPLS
jgi:hypothetical protein